MPRKARLGLTAPFFHVVNRSAYKAPLFVRRADYRAFVDILRIGLTRYPVTLVSYCILGNHWHLVLEPAGTAGLVRFMQWVTATHAVRWHRNHQTVGLGALYQGRYYSSPLDCAGDLVRACRYVERNALTAGLVARAQDWPWCSLADRLRAEPALPLKQAKFLSTDAWIDHVNRPGPEGGIDQAAALMETGRRTSGTRGVISVENTSDPLGTAPLGTAPLGTAPIKTRRQTTRPRRQAGSPAA